MNNEIETRIAQMANDNQSDVLTELRISNVLKELGMSCNLSGYEYIKFAVDEVMKSKSTIKPSMSKMIYPDVAAHFKTTTTRAERAIRHAIERAWNRGNINLLEEIFSYSVDDRKGKTTNSEFLFCIAEYLKLHPNRFCD